MKNVFRASDEIGVAYLSIMIFRSSSDYSNVVVSKNGPLASNNSKIQKLFRNVKAWGKAPQEIGGREENGFNVPILLVPPSEVTFGNVTCFLSGF